MNDSNLDRFITEIIKIVDKAGEKIMEKYGTDFRVDRKNDSSLVTEADTAAEQIIINGLHRLTRDIPVVAEEEISRGIVKNISNGIFWLVDPLDGTKEFVENRNEFTVNIALVKNTVPVLGVVGAPALGTLYVSTQTGVAFKRINQTYKKLKANRVPRRNAIIVASRSHGNDDKLKQFIQNTTSAEIKIVGSSLKFCMLAEGSADIYPRFGDTSEWDTAAGDSILRAAGGSVLTLNGENLCYGKEKFLNADFIAYGVK